MKIIRINSNYKHFLTLQENYHTQKTITEEKNLINDKYNLANNTLFKLIGHQNRNAFGVRQMSLIVVSIRRIIYYSQY